MAEPVSQNQNQHGELNSGTQFSQPPATNNAERMLQLMLDNLPFGMFWKDKQSCYLGCNQLVAKSFGLASPQEVVGLNDYGLSGLSREQADQFITCDRLVMNQNAPLLGIIEKVTRADGTTIWIETNKFPTHDSSGAVNGVLGTWQDITARAAAEAGLREREGQLATFVEHAPVPIAMFDHRMCFLHASRRWNQEMHLGEGDLRGMSLYEVVPNIPERWKSVHRRCLAGEVLRSEEDRFDLTDGTTLWLRWECRPWFEAGGNVGGIIIYGEEITAQKRSVEERALLSAIVESSEDAIISMSLDGTILSWNGGAERLFGYTSAEAIGRPTGLIVPANRQHEEKNFLSQLKLQANPASFETIRQTRSGESLHISATLSPIRNERAEIIGMSSILRDITTQKRNAAVLQQREILVRSATDNASIGLVMLDRNRRYVFANATYPIILGLPWAATDLIGRCPAEVLPEIYASEIAPRLDRAFAGERLTYELAMPRPNQALAYFVVIYDPVFNASNVVEGVIVTIFDISERKRSEEQRLKLEEHLRQAQKLESLGVLAGGIAHDFNNVLTSILGYADLALLELPPHSSARPLIAEVVNGARKAADLTRQMLAYSGKGKFVVEALGLNDLIEDMVHLLQVSISKKCVLKLNLMPELPSIEADAVQMRQIIMNLIINASDAIGDRSGVISISTGVMHCDRKYLSESYLDENLPEGAYVFFEVADSGCGMSNETRLRIFDPFFTTKSTGRGLGLAAAIGIVRGHRGVLKVYSEIDKGSTFKVALPATDIAAQVGPRNDTGTVSWRGSGTVLLVDDEESVRGLVRCMLEMMGFTVLTACDGREAVEVFRRNSDNIRLVLLDMTMPHLDGSETFRELRRISGNVKTILTSGYNEQSAITQFAGKGLAGFIQKPFRYEELQVVVRKAIG